MDDDNNKIEENECDEEHDFRHNFINMPWDDRTAKSKVGIVSLLLSIFVATMALVIQNIFMHFISTPRYDIKVIKEIKCHLVKMDELPFTARIYSVETQELLCVGAVITSSSVLANGVCLRSGPVRVHVGSMSDPRCKRGFAVDGVEPFTHEGIVSKSLAVISAKIENCGHVIDIGVKLIKDEPAYIIGRPLNSGSRSFSRQSAKIVDKRKGTLEKTICVTDLTNCPVKAGDLLVQGGKLFGLASTSTPVDEFNNLACFADLRVVGNELNKM